MNENKKSSNFGFWFNKTLTNPDAIIYKPEELVQIYFNELLDMGEDKFLDHYFFVIFLFFSE